MTELAWTWAITSLLVPAFPVSFLFFCQRSHIQGDAVGFSGESCELLVKYCDNVVCENNSTCIEDADSFKCVCSKGFLGRRCNIQSCDYKPCHSYSVCVSLAVENATKNDFRCL